MRVSVKRRNEKLAGKPPRLLSERTPSQSLGKLTANIVADPKVSAEDLEKSGDDGQGILGASVRSENYRQHELAFQTYASPLSTMSATKRTWPWRQSEMNTPVSSYNLHIWDVFSSDMFLQCDSQELG